MTLMVLGPQCLFTTFLRLVRVRSPRAGRWDGLPQLTNWNFYECSLLAFASIVHFRSRQDAKATRIGFGSTSPRAILGVLLHGSTPALDDHAHADLHELARSAARRRLWMRMEGIVGMSDAWAAGSRGEQGRGGVWCLRR